MSNVESTTDLLRNRVAEALLDENGLPPTRAALDVIMAVVRETERTDERWNHATIPVPSISNYAHDVEKAMRRLRRTR